MSDLASEHCDRNSICGSIGSARVDLLGLIDIVLSKRIERYAVVLYVFAQDNGKIDPTSLPAYQAVADYLLKGQTR
jgi:hypothetical protein